MLFAHGAQNWVQEAKHASGIPLPEETITTPEVQEAPLSRLAYSTSASTQVQLWCKHLTNATSFSVLSRQVKYKDNPFARMPTGVCLRPWSLLENVLLETQSFCLARCILQSLVYKTSAVVFTDPGEAG